MLGLASSPQVINGKRYISQGHFFLKPLPLKEKEVTWDEMHSNNWELLKKVNCSDCLCQGTVT